jgi:hypothetical protein
MVSSPSPPNKAIHYNTVGLCTHLRAQIGVGGGWFLGLVSFQQHKNINLLFTGHGLCWKMSDKIECIQKNFFETCPVLISRVDLKRIVHRELYGNHQLCGTLRMEHHAFTNLLRSGIKGFSSVLNRENLS